jgi:trypsin-like peptidase/PEGA domain-containing protein
MGHTQNHLSLTRSLRVPVVAAMLLAPLLVVWAAPAETAGGKMAEQFRQNTVRIQSARHGFGFIVGERGGFLYIATARHILIPEDQPDAGPAKAKVSFFSDQGTTYDAEVLGTHQANLDLAVLKVRKPANLEWNKQCLAGPEKESRGTQVWFVGKRDDWYVPFEPGTIVSEVPATDSTVEIERLTVSPGTSGAPLIADTGVVGMILSAAPEDTTRALTIDLIKRAFQNWNHPWDLTAGTVQRAPVTLSAAPVAPKTENLTPPSPDKKAAVAEKPATCPLQVNSNPAGAYVYLDDAPYGVTPLKLDLPADHGHALSIESDNYQDHVQTVTCATNTVTVNLKPLAARQQQLAPAPAGATVRVRYTGDRLGCTLVLYFGIAGVKWRQPAYLWTVPGVPAGQQPYEVTGQIGCSNGGCQAYGRGSINVVNGAFYDIFWEYKGYDACAVQLQGPFMQ